MSHEFMFVPWHIEDAVGEDLSSKLLSLMKAHEQRFGERPVKCKIRRSLAMQMNQGQPFKDFVLKDLEIEFTQSGNTKFVLLAHQRQVDGFEFVSVMAVPTDDTICDFLTDRVRGYYGNPELLDPNMGFDVRLKSKRKKKEKTFTPQQRALLDYGGRYAVEGEYEIYYWGKVRMRFFMNDKCFRRF